MFPYENLEVYKKAFSANQLTYRFLKGNKSIPGYGKDQFGRASLSIILNIAEGSGKVNAYAIEAGAIQSVFDRHLSAAVLISI